MMHGFCQILTCFISDTAWEVSSHSFLTKLFWNKQYQLYHKADTDCLLLTSFIFGKAHFPCPREVPALLSFRLSNGNLGMFASFFC